MTSGQRDTPWTQRRSFRRPAGPFASSPGVRAFVFLLNLSLVLAAGAGPPAFAAAGPAGATAPAEQVVFEAALSGARAVPPTATGEIGTAQLVLEEVGGEVRYRIVVSGLRGEATALWIQRGGPGVAGEVLLSLAPGELVEGVWRPGAAVLRDLREERLCVVVPTDLHPTGEIRGDLRQLSLASDQETWGRLKAIFSGGRRSAR